MYLREYSKTMARIIGLPDSFTVTKRRDDWLVRNPLPQTLTYLRVLGIPPALHPLTMEIRIRWWRRPDLSDVQNPFRLPDPKPLMVYPERVKAVASALAAVRLVY